MSFVKNPDNPDLPVCKNMRTKASYVPDMDNQHFMEVHHPYSQYFCLRTLHVIGPDDDIVCPEECTPARACFEPFLKSEVA